VLAQLSAANAEQARTIRELEAPQEEAPQAPETVEEAPQAPETVEEAPERAEESYSATEGAQEGAGRPQQRSGWLAPVDKLPWWHYVVGFSLMYLGIFLTFSVGGAAAVRWVGPSPIITVIGGLVVVWALPGVFGFWVGFRQRNLPRASYEVLYGLAVLLTLICFVVLVTAWWGGGFKPLIQQGLTEILILVGLLVLYGFAPWLAYVSGSVIGNAWQRRRMIRMSGTTSVSPVSRGAAQGAGQQPRKDLTPAQQAMLGWGGAIISALIGLVGTIITVRSGS
jgi:hypothetical protein